MRILHTVEFYHPSVGGAQEVVRQISERLAARGHEVTVATTRLPERTQQVVNGVMIREFDISGNAVKGIRGEADRYQQFLINSNFDLMMNYAAQQWSMDLVFPVLDRIPFKKVMIPCGFSALYNPVYTGYFTSMPGIMRKYDHLVFHTGDYRDIEFAREHGITHLSVIPNGASEEEFETGRRDFRSRYGIEDDELMLLTVGSHTGLKGHELCLKSLRCIEASKVVLVIAGNQIQRSSLWKSFFRPFGGALLRGKPGTAVRKVGQLLFGGVGEGCMPDCTMRSRWINMRGGNKRVLLLDLPREDVVAAYHAADLFLFGSNIEYSPLVIYETLASRTPFVSLACGNVEEIASSTGGGVIASTIRKENGYVESSPELFSQAVNELLHNPDKLNCMREAGHAAWKASYTWDKISRQYEHLYERLCSEQTA